MGGQLLAFSGMNWSLCISADYSYSSVTYGESKACKLADPKLLMMLRVQN